jgi:proteasome assembly chaperone (PAC2) family protein
MPGVGDVGKLVVDAINENLDAEPVARLVHPSLPPVATMDADGLLAPPHLLISRIEIDNKVFFTLTGDAQPTSAEGQYEVATWILEAFCHGEVITLAGMASPPERKEVFAICSAKDYRIELEKKGVDVRRDEPKAGVMGMAAMITSLSTIHNVNACCVIATTIGNSADPISAQGLLDAINTWWGLAIPVSMDAMDRLASRLAQLDNGSGEDHVGQLLEQANSIYM